MRKLLWATISVALVSMVFAGCKKEPTYTVQVTATEGGTVEGQNGEYKEGETIVFTAVPAEGYYFSKWSDGNTNNPRTFTISNAEITLTAQFVQNPLLTISASDNGTVEPAVNGRYAPGSNITITAKPDADCFFMFWSDGNTDNPRTITIDDKYISLEALFFAPTIDLGLESGTLWSTCNLGATVSWNIGDHYGWGETETKDDYYIWETYKYCKGSDRTLTKYCNNTEFGYNGFTDALTNLLPEDDAATAVLGSDYSIPTAADWDELSSQCYWVWTSNYNNKDVSGYIVYKTKFTGDKGKKVFSGDKPSTSYSLSNTHIFLPAAGVCGNAGLVQIGLAGWYWSASLYNNYPNTACHCIFDSSSMYTASKSNFDRRVGSSVRPVRRK